LLLQRGVFLVSARDASIIADNLSKAGWIRGCVWAVNSSGRTIFVVHAHRGDGKRFVDGREKNLNELAFESDRREQDKRNLLPFQFHSRSLIGKR